MDFLPTPSILDPHMKSETAPARAEFTEETLRQAEKTELDAHLANRLGKAESTKRGAEKIMKQTEMPLNQTQEKERSQRQDTSPEEHCNPADQRLCFCKAENLLVFYNQQT
ncbi:endophilin-B1-like isoform X2 [Narcine bancroftii]|uniref:endophilin-B1-like isoform X2 n=1 Tax=Narcine bancroftii TaxID=1343680 RepID=UPI003831956C